MKEIMKDPYFSSSDPNSTFNKKFQFSLENPDACIHGNTFNAIKKKSGKLLSLICAEEDNDFIEIKLLASSSLVGRYGCAKHVLDVIIDFSVIKNKPILAICSNWKDLPQLGYTNYLSLWSYLICIYL